MQAETRARESLEEVTDLALEFGRLSMEAGASARHVDDITERIALDLGAERVVMRRRLLLPSRHDLPRSRRNHTNQQSWPAGREPAPAQHLERSCCANRAVRNDCDRGSY